MHLTTLVSEVGTVQKLHCPDPSCPHMANEWELEQLIGWWGSKVIVSVLGTVEKGEEEKRKQREREGERERKRREKKDRKEMIKSSFNFFFLFLLQEHKIFENISI